MSTVTDFYREYEKNNLEQVRLPSAITEAYEIKACLKMSQEKQIYLAVSKINWRKYIIKAVSCASHENPEEEYRLNRSLKHPGIVPVCELISEGDYRYLVREYTEGSTITELVEMSRDGHLHLEEIIRIALLLCDILEYLHSCKPAVIHRDIKSDNIIMNEQGECKLIDFGISRQFNGETEADTVAMGTRFSAPPEQYGFAQTDARSDIYALGVLIFYMATGSPDIKEIEDYAIAKGLLGIIRKCTRFSPSERYETVKQLKASLIRCSFPARQKRRLCTGAAVAGLLLLSGMVLFVNQWKEIQKYTDSGQEAGTQIAAVDGGLTGNEESDGNAAGKGGAVTGYGSPEEGKDTIPAPMGSDEVSQAPLSSGRIPDTQKPASGLTSSSEQETAASEISSAPQTASHPDKSIKDAASRSEEVSLKEAGALPEAEAGSNSAAELVPGQLQKPSETLSARNAKASSGSEQAGEGTKSPINNSKDTIAEVKPNPSEIPDTAYEFKSPLIEQAVREILGKSEKDEITRKDLSEITSLYLCGRQTYRKWNDHFVYGKSQFMRVAEYNASGQYLENGGITDLTDISQMINLESLALYNQNISDLTPLGKLRKLKQLGVGANSITVLDPLLSVESLEFLDLSANPVDNTDIKSLTRLPALKGLDLGGTDISSIYGIKDIPLTYLSVYDSKTGACEGLDQIKTLETFITTGVGNTITEAAIERIARLPALRYLHIMGSGEFDLSKLSSLDTLYSMDLCGSLIKDLKPLETLSIEQLWLDVMPSFELAGIEKLEKLVFISLGGTNCTDYTPLLKLKHLKAVNCNEEQQKIMLEQLGEIPFRFGYY
jgi:Leucine-rich repeat (LRR) protein